MQRTLLPIKTIVVPDWVQRGLVNNKLNVMDIGNYSKLRTVLSIDDMSELYYINTQLRINNILLSSVFGRDLFEHLTPDQLQEFENSVAPLSGTEEIANTVRARLSKASVGDSPLYSFVVLNNVIYIILKDGFMTLINDTQYVLDFVKAYLKECYVLLPIHEVSKLPLFALYIEKI